jgi:hypothetical protein
MSVIYKDIDEDILMSVIYKDIDEDILKKHKGRIIGWYAKYGQPERLLISSKSNTRSSIALSPKGGVNPIILKCGKCQGDMGDNSIIMGGRCFTLNEFDGQMEGSIEIEYASVYSVFLCPKCEKKKMLEIAAILKCKPCDKQIAWMEAGRTPEGFEIKAGETYHSKECQKCNPESERVAIIEMKEWFDEKKKPDKEADV